MSAQVTFASWAVGAGSRKEGDDTQALVVLMVNGETVYISPDDARRIADSLTHEAALVDKYVEEVK